MMRRGLVLLVAALATVVGWRLLDGYLQAANVEGPLHGVTYAPWAKDQDPLEGRTALIQGGPSFHEVTEMVAES